MYAEYTRPQSLHYTLESNDTSSSINLSVCIPVICSTLTKEILLFFCGEWYTYDGLADAVVHLNFRAGSTFPVPVCTVPVLYPVQQG